MRRFNLIFLLGFIGISVWILLFQPDVIRRIQSGAMVVFRPFTEASNRLGSTARSGDTDSLSRAELQQRIRELNRQRDRLRLEANRLDELRRENNRLRRALRYEENSPLRLVAARIINRKPSNWYSTMVIDKGERDGIVPDSPVIVPVEDRAGLVGRISEVVGANSAVVLLLTDEICQVSAKLENSQEQGILSGRRGALQTRPNLRLRYLSKEVEASPGRRVISSGAGGLFPPDLLLGTILSLEIGAIDAEATVEPSVNFEELHDVFVVLPADTGPTTSAEGSSSESPAGGDDLPERPAAAQPESRATESDPDGKDSP